MNDILKDYFYTGISFSSYFIDEGVFLCLKVENSKNPITKCLSLLKLKKYLKNHSDTDECLVGNEKYLVYQNMVALNNASVLFSTNNEHIKLYRKLKGNKEAIVCDKFSINDLTEENLDYPLTIIIYSEKSKNKYEDIISKGKDVRFVYLENIKDETNREIIFDAIKVKLLQDETELYIIEEGMYANYIANFIFTLNKIAIIY